MVYGLLNALVESELNEDAGNMAAVDPAAFGQVAPLIDSDFVGTTAASAMDALQRQPDGVFLGLSSPIALMWNLATTYRCSSHGPPKISSCPR